MGPGIEAKQALTTRSQIAGTATSELKKAILVMILKVSKKGKVIYVMKRNKTFDSGRRSNATRLTYITTGEVG